MNIKYHVACGVALDFYFKTNGIMTLFSVLPDLPLIGNEIKLLKEKKKFDEKDVSQNIMDFYFFTHSVFMLVPVYTFFDKAVIAYGLHIVADWFTHTGRFAARPFFPDNYTIKFGRNILK